MMGETKKDRIQLLVRRFFLFLTDTFLLNACVYLSLIMRFDVGIVSIEPQYISNYVENVLPYNQKTEEPRTSVLYRFRCV